MCGFIRGMAFVDCMTFIATDVYGEPTFRPEAKPLGAVGLDYKREQEALLEELAEDDGLPSAAPLDDATREKIQDGLRDGTLTVQATKPEWKTSLTPIRQRHQGGDPPQRRACTGSSPRTRPSEAQAISDRVWGEVPTRPGTTTAT